MNYSFFDRILVKKRRQRTEAEAQNKIRGNQLRTSKKVHDVVANRLYRMISEVENQDKIDRGGLLDKMDVLYERSRDISYDAPQQKYSDFHLKVAELILAFATDDTKVIVANNDEGV